MKNLPEWDKADYNFKLNHLQEALPANIRGKVIEQLLNGGTVVFEHSYSATTFMVGEHNMLTGIAEVRNEERLNQAYRVFNNDTFCIAVELKRTKSGEVINNGELDCYAISPTDNIYLCNQPVEPSSAIHTAHMTFSRTREVMNDLKSISNDDPLKNVAAKASIKMAGRDGFVNVVKFSSDIYMADSVAAVFPLRSETKNDVIITDCFKGQDMTPNRENSPLGNNPKFSEVESTTVVGKFSQMLSNALGAVKDLINSLTGNNQQER